MDQPELSTLLARCRAGDELAWEAFVYRFQGRIYALAYSYAGDREDARDLAQDIFIRLFESRSQWADGNEFLPWLIRVARNRSVDFLRRRKVRRPTASVREDEGLGGATEGQDARVRLGRPRRRIDHGSLGSLVCPSARLLDGSGCQVHPPAMAGPKTRRTGVLNWAGNSGLRWSSSGRPGNTAFRTVEAMTSER